MLTIIAQLIAQRISDMRPCFAGNQVRGSNVPLITPADRRYQIGAIIHHSSDHDGWVLVDCCA